MDASFSAIFRNDAPIGRTKLVVYRRTMRGFRASFFSALMLVSCSGNREQPREAPLVVVPSSMVGAAPSPLPSDDAPLTSANAPVAVFPSAAANGAATPSAAVPNGPTPYPEAWLSEARRENIGLSCLELVYKNGCSQTRTGIVTFEVTIDETGSVLKFSEVDNQIRHDKAVVSRCLKNNLLKWKFHPPEGHLPTFQVQVALADRC